MKPKLFPSHIGSVLWVYVVSLSLNVFTASAEDRIVSPEAALARFDAAFADTFRNTSPETIGKVNAFRRGNGLTILSKAPKDFEHLNSPNRSDRDVVGSRVAVAKSSGRTWVLTYSNKGELRVYIDAASGTILCVSYIPEGSAIFPDTQPAAAKPEERKDPRSVMLPVIMYRNQKLHNESLQDALLVFSRHDTEHPNQILGIEGSFTDEQILMGLRKFYREWRAPANHPPQARPQLILAIQNWGDGSIRKHLEPLSIEFETDVYELYPVVTQLESKAGHPTPNDKRLAELIKGG